MVLVVPFMVSCDRSKTVELDVVEGYFIRNDVAFASEVTCLVLKDQVEFETYFGVAKTMNNRIAETSFDSTYLAAILLRPSVRIRDVKITGSTIKGNKLEVNYAIKQKGKQPSKSTALKILKFPQNIKSVNFVSEQRSELIQIR